MLRELHIKNFSIIDDVSVQFSEGFNVLTGETGAGKSIIINALSLALGERASGEIVRSNEKEALIEVFFDIAPSVLSSSAQQILQDSGLDIEEGLILKRIITVQGKNRSYVNGSMVNVQTLSDISKNIVDIHGQYEHQSLLSSENQLDLLDAYGNLMNERSALAEIYASLRALKKQITERAQKEQDRAQRVDILQYQIHEIEAAGLRAGEEEELREELKFLSNAGRLAELANQSYDALSGSDSSCIDSLSEIISSLKEISEIDGRAGDPLKSAQEALPLLEETGYFLRDYKDSLDFDPSRLDQVQERIEVIKGLGRKYGQAINEILSFYEKARIELEELQHSGETLDALKTELEEVRKRLGIQSLALSKKRKAVAKKIEKGLLIFQCLTHGFLLLLHRKKGMTPLTVSGHHPME